MSKKNNKIEFKLLQYSVPKISYTIERAPADFKDAALNIQLSGNLGIDKGKKNAKVEFEVDIKEKSENPKIILNITMDFEYDIINGEGKTEEELSDALRTIVEKETVKEVKLFIENLTEMTKTNVIHLPI
jgi:preprotein translocase subunit SecB